MITHLKQRNQLLSQIAFQESLIDTLEVWDMQLVQYGSSMIEKRKEFIEELNKLQDVICKSFNSNSLETTAEINIEQL